MGLYSISRGISAVAWVGWGASLAARRAPCRVAVVARRSSPDQTYSARRAATLSRLTQERRLSAERAEALVAAWEAEGDSRRLDRMTAAFLDDGTRCIEEQLGG